MAEERESGLSVGIVVYIDFLDALRESNILHDACTWEPKLDKALGALKYVDEVCLSHQAWVKANLETDDFALAARRCASLKLKISAAISRLSKKVKSHG